MDVNTELLEYIYQSSEMGVVSLTNLLKDINGKENKLKPIISEELSSYEKYQKESKKLLFKNNTEVKENSMMTKMMSKMGISKEVKKDNSDAAIAHMVIEGFTMGVVDMETKIKNFKKEKITLRKERRTSYGYHDDNFVKFLCQNHIYGHEVAEKTGRK